MRYVGSAFLWLSAILLVVIPLAVSLDHGGFHHWTRYVAAQAVLIAAALALPGLFDRTASSGLAQHRLLIPLGLLAGLAWLQSIALPAGVVALLSPGASAAYHDWLASIMPVDQTFLSVSPFDTHHAASIVTVLLPLAFAASLVFHSRNRLTFLLSSIAIIGAITALVGIYRKLDPSADIWFFDGSSNAFAGFRNRNNAALLLNLGMGAALGLLSWRTMALHQIELDDPDFEFTELFSLVSDRESFIGLSSATLCAAGLLINGSRGGLVAAIAGLVVAFGYVRPKRGLISLPVMLVTIVVSVAILTIPLKLDLQSIQRLEMISNKADTLQNDGRLNHWPDGWQAAKAYFPLGSGMASYSYAYLPYQEMTPPTGHFEHADNLWLEMLVETGLVGVLVFVLVLVLLIVALRHLGYSVDPVDQGIRIAGCYMIAAIIVSQFFDFGLISVANTMISVLMAAAIISRDIANGGAAVMPQHDVPIAEMEEDQEAKPTTGKIRLRSSSRFAWLRQSLVPGLLAILLIAGGLATLPGLRLDAQTDDVFLQLRHGRYAKFNESIPALSAMDRELSALFNIHPDPLLGYQLLCSQRDLAYLTEIDEWRPITDTPESKLRAALALNTRGLSYPPPPKNGIVRPIESQKHYLHAWQTGLRSLTHCPFSQDIRYHLVLLYPLIDAIDKPDRFSPAKTTDDLMVPLISQTQELHARWPDRLLDFGLASANRTDWQRATQALHQANQLSGRLVSRVMPVLEKHRQLVIKDVVPEEPSALRTAASAVLQWDQPDDAFLREAVEKIRCNDGAGMRERSACEHLVAEIYYHLEENDRGGERMERAIRLNPENAKLRLRYIEHLRRLQDRPTALQQARMGRQSFPDNPQFQQIIDEMAQSDRQELLTPNQTLKETQKTLQEILQ